MNRSRRRYFVLVSGLLVFLLLFILFGQTVLAHRSGGYSHDSSIGISHPDWMGTLPDSLRISELSIPGTHDTMAKCGDDIPKCQTLTLERQLDAGIRALDIRARRIWNHFDITHGCWQNSDDCGNLLVDHYEFDDALCRTVNFLDDHPGETVLMRVQDAGCPIDPHRPFEATYLDYVENQREPCESNGQQILFRDYIWKGDFSSVPTLGEVRGKIVILDNFAGGKYGLDWNDLEIQDWYDFTTNWDLDDKWYRIEAHLNATNTGDLDDIYVNFLSGSGGSFPYFVASGHSSPGTGDPRLWTGMLWDNVTGSTCGSTNCYPFFPRLSCVEAFGIRTCSVYFEGTNEILTYYWIRGGRVGRRIGIIMADFPGPALIEEIINLNPWNWPPEADAGGPYQGDEGSPITFDASASTDADGDSLSFRWDFDNDGNWDTVLSSNPTASHIWYDDWSGTAKVEVSDGYATDTATASVTVNNVAPTVDAGPNQTANEGDVVSLAPATFSDKGTLDTHTATISWGDGTPLDVGVVSESPVAADADRANRSATEPSVTGELFYLPGSKQGTVSGSHVYADNGSYIVEVCVTDDDGATTCDDLSVTVNNVAPVAGIDRITDETGAEIGRDVPVALVGLAIDVAGSFNDAGTLDSHMATLEWGDGTPAGVGLVKESPFGPPGDTAGMNGTVSGSHIYMTPGVYTVFLTVTDDDGESDRAREEFEVADPIGAIEGVIADLDELANDPDLDPAAAAHIQDALDKLDGGSDGRAENGAIDLLDKGNLNAALGKIKQALRYLNAGEAADAKLDLTFTKGLLALSAKSVAVDAIAKAEAVATKPNETRKIGRAKDLVARGDRLLAAYNYVGAVARYQEAVRRVQGIF